MVVTIQLEVAERIVAGSDEMSYLSVAAQLAAEVDIVRRIPPGAFYPQPKVESAVLRLRLRPSPLVPIDSPREFLELVQAGFTQPRKRLDNSLAQGLDWPKARAALVLTAAGIDPALRPQALSIQDWYRVFLASTSVSS
jgi:16S rRNA (adenine1518-N6/adenine1519-N6)-dimethyltransferase